MAEVDGGASVLGNNPLVRLHPGPGEEKYPWRGVERRQQGKRARKKESKKEQVKSPSTRCCPGELRKIRRSLLEVVWIGPDSSG